MNTFADSLNKEIENKRIAEKDAFHQLLELIAPVNHDKAISLYVQATFAKFWEGWNSRTLSDLEDKN